MSLFFWIPWRLNLRLKILTFQTDEDVLLWDEVEGIFKKDWDDNEEAEIIEDKNFEWECHSIINWPV